MPASVPVPRRESAASCWCRSSFTSSTEARIYRELGDALSGMVESYSFTSLAEHILAIEGGAAVQTLTDAGRAVLVRRALEELQDNVHYYSPPPGAVQLFARWRQRPSTS